MSVVTRSPEPCRAAADHFTGIQSQRHFRGGHHPNTGRQATSPMQQGTQKEQGFGLEDRMRKARGPVCGSDNSETRPQTPQGASYSSRQTWYITAHRGPRASSPRGHRHCATPSGSRFARQARAGPLGSSGTCVSAIVTPTVQFKPQGTPPCVMLKDLI